MKSIFTTIFLSTVTLVGMLHAQNTDQQVISSAGGYGEAGGYSISWTLGETVVETLEGGSYVLTQGFQQSFFSIVDDVIEENFTHEVKLWPNPATEVVNISVINSNKAVLFNWALVDITGKTILNGKGENGKTSIDITGLTNSLYFITISDGSNAKSTYKLIKQ